MRQSFILRIAGQLITELRWLIGAIGIPWFFSNRLVKPDGLSSTQWALILYSPALLAAGFLLAALFIWIKVAVAKQFGKNIYREYVGPDRIDFVWDLCRSFYFLDEHVINKKSLLEFMEVDEKVAKVFTFKGVPVGLWIVFRIRMNAVEALLSGKYQNAQCLNAKHRVVRPGHESALYITNICARGSSFVQGTVVDDLRDEIKERLKASRSIRHIFGRHANEDGGRLLGKFKFKPVIDKMPAPCICKVDVVPDLVIALEDSAMLSQKWRSK